MDAEAITFGDVGHSIELKITFSNGEAARLTAVALDVARNQDLIQLNTEARKLDEKIPALTPRELFGDWRAARLILAVAGDLLKNWTVKVRDEDLLIQLPLPTQMPMAVLAGSGSVVSIVAASRFRISKRPASRRA